MTDLTPEPDPSEPRFVVSQIPAPPAAPAPSMAETTALYEAAHQVRLAELAKLEKALTGVVALFGLTVVRTEPVEQVAACPCTVRRLAEVLRYWHRPPLALNQFYAMAGLPIMTDPDLPEGDVHLRPLPRPAEDETKE